MASLANAPSPWRRAPAEHGFPKVSHEWDSREEGTEAGGPSARRVCGRTAVRRG